MNPNEPSILAALGPTNTGKTHRAVQRMLEHDSGMIGLPLRLLAREVYDRITQALGESQVALVTGEEKRIPDRPRYWVCTVEAMPMDRRVDFLAIDEIQLAAHPERGHVFTERLLHGRGRRETWFMGADTMRRLVGDLVPEARIQRFPRLSRLTAAGSYSLGSLPPRSAVVAFSAPRLYQLAERLRARRGGAAIVLGALSPRARNAQVAMYQAGEVDYLVATDAIGMGLNLDVDQIAFAEHRKFDGRETRPLDLGELSQIAGRAGRFQNDGAFGALSPEPPLRTELLRRIETHRLPELTRLTWRNHQLCFDSADALVSSLKQRPGPGPLSALAQADDFRALTTLLKRGAIRERAVSPDDVSLLWDVCQIPDYRQLLLDQHPNLLSEIYLELTARSRLGDDWLQGRFARLNRFDGDIETLMKRLAFVRTWTYVSNHDRWLARPRFWQDRTRDLEDRLSDALHRALVARFIDLGRTSASLRGGPPRSAAGHPFSALEELRAKLVAPEKPSALDAGDFAQALAEAAHTALVVDERGHVGFRGVEVARFTRGRVLTEPEISLSPLQELPATPDSGASPALGPGALGQVRRRLQAFAKDFVRDALGALTTTRDEDSPALRGLLYQLSEGLGTALRPDVEPLLVELTTHDRWRLDQLGVVVGQRTVFLHSQLEPDAHLRRRVLVRAFHGPRAPSLSSASTSERVQGQNPRRRYLELGYLVAGGFAIRVDVVERLLDEHTDRPSQRLVARSCRVSLGDARAIRAALTPRSSDKARSGTRKRRRRQRTKRSRVPASNTRTSGAAPAQRGSRPPDRVNEKS